MIAIIVSAAILTLLFFMNRYVPVHGVKEMDIDHASGDTVILDTRDYQTSNKDAVDEAYCIPLSYLNRHHTDLPNKKVILIVEDHVEKNLCTRLLRRKGYEVIGYMMASQMSGYYPAPCICEK
jgi:hypothetical protein